MLVPENFHFTVARGCVLRTSRRQLVSGLPLGTESSYDQTKVRNVAGEGLRA